MTITAHTSRLGTNARGETVHCITLDNGRMQVDILTRGGALAAIRVPDRAGRLANVVLLISFAAEAHFDSLMTAALLAALLAVLHKKTSVWLWLGVAIQIKLVCLVLVPLFLTRRLLPRAWLLLVVLV